MSICLRAFGNAAPIIQNVIAEDQKSVLLRLPKHRASRGCIPFCKATGADGGILHHLLAKCPPMRHF
jgi:hypothetical protein